MSTAQQNDQAASCGAGHRLKPVLQVRVALLALDFYKVYVSPWLAGSCRYQPTCSRYTYEAIERFGVARGMWLGMKRLLRCHPFTKRFGYDPVPEKWEEMRREESKSISSGAEARENGDGYVGAPRSPGLTKDLTPSGQHILLQPGAGRSLPSSGQAEERTLQRGVRS